MTDRTFQQLGYAINESELLGVEVVREHRRVGVTLSMLTLPDDGAPPPDDPRVLFVFEDVGRFVASLRHGAFDDENAPVAPIELHEVAALVRSFGGQPIYGWDFFDQEEDFDQWRDRLSLDESFSGGRADHSISLFQEGDGRHLDLRIWFGGLRLLSPNHEELDVEDVIEGARRWWIALYEGDPRTQGKGIGPASRGGYWRERQGPNRRRET